MTARSSVEGLWDLINTYVFPFRGDAYGNHAGGEETADWWRNRRVYNSTPIQSANILAASIHSSLTSDAFRWFEMEFRSPALKKDRDARVWLQNSVMATHQSFMDSNFSLESNETYLDVVGYGHSAMFSNEKYSWNRKFSGFEFESVPVEEFVFEPDHNGRPLRWYRYRDWTALQIVSKFGKDLVPDKIRELASKSSDVDTKFRVIFCIYPREGKERFLESGRKLAPKQRPFGCKWVLHDTKEELGEESGYYEMPVFMPRWRKTSRSVWGHGPAAIAMPEILSLNELDEMILNAAAKAIDPSIMVTERGLLSEIDLRSGGVTTLRTLDDMKAFNNEARFDVGAMKREDLERAIQRIFYVDQLQLKDSPSMTATESNIRYELMQRLLGPTAGRMRSDYMDPMVKRQFMGLWRAGKLEPPPQSVIAAGPDSELDIVYTGPLIRAQRADIATGVTRWLATIAELGNVNPDVLDVPDWDKIAIELGSLEGVPAELVASPSEISKKRRQRTKVQNAQAAGATAEQVGKGMEAMGKGNQALRVVGGTDASGQDAAAAA